jgi:hypothetical protein
VCVGPQQLLPLRQHTRCTADGQLVRKQLCCLALLHTHTRSLHKPSNSSKQGQNVVKLHDQKALPFLA